MPRCRSCSAEIAFLRLRSGKAVPVEDLEFEEYSGFTAPVAESVPITVVSEDGIFATLYVLPPGKVPSGPRSSWPARISIRGVESHFPLCVIDTISGGGIEK